MSPRSLWGGDCRIGPSPRKINLSKVFAGQNVGVKQTTDHIWLVSFMDYELGSTRVRRKSLRR